MAKETKKEETKRFEVVEVSTQTALMVRDNKTESVLDDKQIVADILNSLEAIKKAVC